MTNARLGLRRAVGRRLAVDAGGLMEKISVGECASPIGFESLAVTGEEEASGTVVLPGRTTIGTSSRVSHLGQRPCLPP